MTNRKLRSSTMTMDDTKVDYTSLMGLEDRRRRFSEDVVDVVTKENVNMQKLYRQIQRQVYCRQDNKETPTGLILENCSILFPFSMLGKDFCFSF